MDGGELTSVVLAAGGFNRTGVVGGWLAQCRFAGAMS